MLNPLIDYTSASGLIETGLPNRPYIMANRRLNRAAQEGSEYSPINYGKIQSADQFKGDVGRFTQPESTGISNSDILGWFNRSAELGANNANDWAKSNEIAYRMVTNGGYDYGHAMSGVSSGMQDAAYNTAMGDMKFTAGRYLFKNGVQINKDDVGRGSGDHIDIHGVGKYKGQNPTQFTNRFLLPNGSTLESALSSGSITLGAGQRFGAPRKAGGKSYSHSGIDIAASAASYLTPNPQYPIKSIEAKYNPNGYGHYVQIHYSDGVSLGLGHLGKKNVDAIMRSYKGK